MRISDWSSDVCSSDLIKEIWRSPLIPSDPMVWRKALPEDAKQKIYYFFMQYGRFGDPEKVQRERKILAEMSDGWGPFLASSNAQLLDVRQKIGRAHVLPTVINAQIVCRLLLEKKQKQHNT